jgi:hypothetical protein
MGFWVSQSLTSLSARTPIGLRPDPLAVSTASGLSRCDRIRSRLKERPSSRRLQLLFRVSLNRSAQPVPTPHSSCDACDVGLTTMPPSKVSFPSASSVIWSHRSHALSHGRVTLHPWVFATLRCFAPQTTFRVYFAPVPLLGFAPRGFSPHQVPFAFSGSASLMTFNTPTEVDMPHLQGSIHLAKHAQPFWLFTAATCAASASFLSSKVSCSSR